MTQATDVFWDRMRAHEIRAAADAGAAVILPIASIEQHGPHLPVMTDSRIGLEIAGRAARKAAPQRRTLVAPVVWSGLSEHHMAFGGVLTLTPETFVTVLCELVTTFARQGFEDVLIANSHGGNGVAMRQAAETLAQQETATVVAVTYFEEAPEAIAEILTAQGALHHADEAETAMMLALEPDLVDATDLAALDAPEPEDCLRAGRAAYRWRPFEHATAHGAQGSPSAATPEKGERLLEAFSDALAALIVDPATWAPAQDLRPDAVGGVPFNDAL